MTHIAACGGFFVFQTEYKQDFHLIKVQVLALMIVPLFQVSESK